MTQTQSPPEEFFWVPEGTPGATDRLVSKADFARPDFDPVRSQAMPVSVRDEGNGQWAAQVVDQNSVKLSFRDQTRDKAIAQLRERLKAGGGGAGGGGATGISGGPTTPTR